MSRATAEDEKTIGLDLSMTAEAYNALLALSRDSGQNVEAVIVKALGMYRVALDATREGKAVGIAAAADVLETEFVGLGPPDA